MNTLLIVAGAWLALIVLVIVGWHHVMQHAHRQDLRRTSTVVGAAIPAPRRSAESGVSRKQV